MTTLMEDRIGVRMTPAERRRVAALARRKELTISAVVRQALEAAAKAERQPKG